MVDKARLKKKCVFKYLSIYLLFRCLMKSIYINVKVAAGI